MAILPTPLKTILYTCQDGEVMADALWDLETRAALLRLPPPPADESLALPERRAALAARMQQELDAHAAMQAADEAAGFLRCGGSGVDRAACAVPSWHHWAAEALAQPQTLPSGSASGKRRWRLPWQR